MSGPGLDLARPLKREDPLRQRKRGPQLLDGLEALLERAGARDHLQNRPTALVLAGVQEEAIVEKSEADDEHVGGIDHTKDLIEVDAELFHLA